MVRRSTSAHAIVSQIAGATVRLSPPSIGVNGQISPKAPQAKEQKTKPGTAKRKIHIGPLSVCQLIITAAVNGGCAMVSMRYRNSPIQVLSLRTNDLGFGAENLGILIKGRSRGRPDFLPAAADQQLLRDA